MTDTGPISRVGTQFGPYKLQRLLGRGGMGEVYAAYDTVKDRTVALKLMSQHFSSDDVFRRRMQREAHTAGRLQEPHIVPIHDYGEIDGQLFIDMRYVDGNDVAALIRREGPLAPPRAVAIIEQVAAALDAAHRAGVIHRDIKPENILLTGEDFAYLADFGIAAAFTDKNVTKTGTAVGSWCYMAPERFDDGEITYRADIYALTCVLYECLTGVPPYSSENLPALMAAHLTRPIPRPSQQNPSVPSGFDDVIARGMAKEPTERYESAGTLAKAAHEALSATDQHRADTLLEHTRQFAPPPSGPMPMMPPQLPLPPQAWAPPRPSQRKPWLLVGAAAVVVAVLVAAAIWLAVRNTGSEQQNSQTTTPITTTAPALSTTTAATTTREVPTVAPAQLNSLLLTPAQINALFSTSGVAVSKTRTDMADVDPGDQLSDAQCLGALIGFQSPTYKSSGYTATVAQLLQKGGNPGIVVVQGAVHFASAQQANQFVYSQRLQWQGCAGKTITQTTHDGKTFAWRFHDVDGTPPKIALVHDSTDNTGATCQHVLSAVSNVVLDVNACASQLTNQASQIATDMAAKVPK
ncbi:serine/threonine protein kinase [Mycobacterium sp. 852002-51163_SCH5372311]|uniref:serine/threonine-protein kinase PknH/PknJ n=1 Tax=Mycobacterium sp. 852002-51163_SCH5372311 TaxID=1834097 RepID=UPI0007FC1B30|nr:serine/threonine-protein kinase PknH/PknJ [Mycobacterium sp. 852002-51163_SCH5372311]OBF79639.1 serine/threonine protein kinase [Mycobacterium sp. 852002-51163_SCH5372311]